jgi:hypothetical protein
MPEEPILEVGETLLLTYGAQGSRARSYRGTWRSSNPLVVATRRWAGKCYTACTQLAALAPGDVTVFFKPEGQSTERSLRVWVE